MSKKTILWLLIIFVLLPAAYYFAFAGYTFITVSKRSIDYLIFIISCAVIIGINIAIIKTISNKK